MAEMIRVLVPFSRPHLIPEIFGFWNRSESVIFHPISHDPNDAIPVSDSVQPFYCGPVPEGWNAMYWKLNYYLDQMPIHEWDMYGFLCDDDIVEPEFYSKVMQYADDVRIVSMKRGTRQPEGGNGHPPTTLIAQPSNMKIGSVGIEQILIRGRHLKYIRFDNFPEADGKFIVNVVNNLPVKYLPNTFVWFNYFEPGRWT